MQDGYMRLQRMSGTLNIIMPNMEIHELTMPSLQTDLSYKLSFQIFQLVDWSIYRKVCKVQCCIYAFKKDTSGVDLWRWSCWKSKRKKRLFVKGNRVMLGSGLACRKESSLQHSSSGKLLFFIRGQQHTIHYCQYLKLLCFCFLRC